jgi:hypothetical protein
MWFVVLGYSTNIALNNMEEEHAGKLLWQRKVRAFLCSVLAQIPQHIELTLCSSRVCVTRGLVPVSCTLL